MVGKMEAKDIQEIYAAHPGVEALMQLREEGGKKRVLLEGLLGSSAAMTLCGLKKRIPEQTLLVVMNDTEEAGYFYHDMMQMSGDNNILFFPSSFRRAMKYGQEDDANRILRTEVMSRLVNRRYKEGYENEYGGLEHLEVFEKILHAVVDANGSAYKNRCEYTAGHLVGVVQGKHRQEYVVLVEFKHSRRGVDGRGYILLRKKYTL